MNRTRGNIWTLDRALTAAEKAGCALGSFSPRLTPMIQPVLLAGQKTQSPLIVQISSREKTRSGVTPPEIADEFYAQVAALGRDEHLSNAECRALPADQLAIGRGAVEATVIDRITNFLGSAGKAAAFLAGA